MILALFITTSAYAQTVTQVNSKKAVVSLPEDSGFVVGDKVEFLTSEMKSSSTGTVESVSNGRQFMSVNIDEGKPQVGQAVEKSGIKKKIKTQKVQLSQLDNDERRILRRGEISDGQYFTGAILGTWPLAFGLGHVIQGRYTEKGYIFTIGELLSVAAIVAGFGDCAGAVIGTSIDGKERSCNGGLFYIGVLGLVGFRIWEIIDLWATPPYHNRRYRQLRKELGEVDEDEITWRPFISPVAKGDGAQFGIQMRF